MGVTVPCGGPGIFWEEPLGTHQFTKRSSPTNQQKKDYSAFIRFIRVVRVTASVVAISGSRANVMMDGLCWWRLSGNGARSSELTNSETHDATYDSRAANRRATEGAIADARRAGTQLERAYRHITG